LKEQNMEYIVFSIGKGWIAILGSIRGLVSITMPQSSAQEALNILGEVVNHASPSSERFKDLIQRLKDYFGGKKVSFPDKLDLSKATPFQRQVWQVTRLIPYGETRSYLWVAEQIDNPKAMQAVGQALARNPLPIIIPCHRVVKSNGKLGGFTGGVEMKRRLLNIEAAAT
jgi:methylated-DNA-[protein]-cysteine S-methyltransferase